MIETRNGATRLEGMGFDLLTDFSLITKNLYDALKKTGMPEEVVKGSLEKAFEVGLLSKEEKEQQAKEAMKSLVEALFK